MTSMYLLMAPAGADGPRMQDRGSARRDVVRGEAEGSLGPGLPTVATPCHWETGSSTLPVRPKPAVARTRARGAETVFQPKGRA